MDWHLLPTGLSCFHSCFLIRREYKKDWPLVTCCMSHLIFEMDLENKFDLKNQVEN